MHAKYIQDDKGGIVIFPAYMNHSDFKHLNPRSAGFILVNGEEVSCYGESLTLALQSDSGDSERAKRLLFPYYY